LYSEAHGGDSIESAMRAAYEQHDQWRHNDGAPAEPRTEGALFKQVRYDGSALVLYALRETIGTGAFERLERRWVAGHRDGTASTADFVALAEQVSGQDLDAFFDGWLYGEKTPPMPGHPDWRVHAPAGAEH
ncbi:M1 family peptidase, partial [Streptomyces hydrogenans]